MKRPIIQWWISGSIDHSHQRSAWLVRQIERDPELRRFDRAARHLEHDLREKAAAWLADDEDRVPQVVRRNWQQSRRYNRMASPRIYGLLAALAAVLLLGVAWIEWGRAKGSLLSRTRVDADRTAGDEPLSPAADPQILAALLDAGQILFEPLNNVPELAKPAWEIPARWRSQARSVVKREVERVYDDVKTSIQRNRSDMTADFNSAFVFFSRRLPLSTARLFGLHPVPLMVRDI